MFSAHNRSRPACCWTSVKSRLFPLFGQGFIDNINNFFREGLSARCLLLDQEWSQRVNQAKVPGGIFMSTLRCAISPQVMVEARPSSIPNSVMRISWTLRIIRNDRLRRIEYTPLDFELLVISLQEMLVEMDNRILAGAAIAEVAQDGGEICLPRRARVRSLPVSPVHQNQYHLCVPQR